MAERPSSETKRHRVLLVDHDPASLEWVRLLLDGEGCEVQSTLVGARAIDLTKAWRPDLVLTDLELPDMDGLALLRDLKRVQEDLEVVLMSERGTVASAVEAMRAGAYTFLEKPLEADGLLRIVDQAIEWRNLRSEKEQLKRRMAGAG